MRNIIIVFLMFILPSLAMAQGQITRKPVTPPPTHKHSVNGPKDCTECNRLRKEKQHIAEQRRKEKERLAEQQRREEEQRLAEERERKAEEEARLAEQKRKEEQRLAEERKRKKEEEAKLAEQKRIIDNLVNNMVYVEGGTFRMGDPNDKTLRHERLVHDVTLSSFYINKYEVTQAEWKAVMGSNFSDFNGDDLPVENVMWDDCQTFIRKLNSITGKNFRLPTEAEWEFAARGGNNSRGYKYSGSNELGSVAWYYRNSESKTHPVGLKSPNELGLYDMSGNVSEWCQDWYGDYSRSSQTNPTGPALGSYRVSRGGSWSLLAFFCSVSERYNDDPRFLDGYLGLRLAEGIIPQAIETKIYGTVVDENNEPLIGATIRLLNTDMGSVADLDGNFLITTSIQDPMIEVSYVGYKTKIVKGTSNMKIKMAPK